MSVTATYSELTSAGNRQWFALSVVGGNLYGLVQGSGIYQLNLSTGAETFKRNETEVNYRGSCAYNGSLATVAYGSFCRAFSTSSFTTVTYNWGSAYGSAWFAICANGTTAYALKYGASTNQIGVFSSDGSVSYLSTTTRNYTGVIYLNGWLYACTDGSQIFKINPSTGAETALSNSPSLGWRGICTDGTYLYSAVYGGRIYRIAPSDGSYEEVLGDGNNRNWQNIEYYSGKLYACVVGGKPWAITLPIPAVPTSSVTSRFSTSLVTLSCSTSGATIKYTIDGSTPGLSNGTTYSSAITISQTTTLKFCAIKDGYVTAGSDVSVTVGSGLIGTYSILNATTRSYSAVGLWTQFYPDSNSTSGHKIYASYSAGGGNDTIAYLNSDGTTNNSATIPSVRGLSLYNMNYQNAVGQPTVISATYGGVVRGVSELDSGGSGWASSSTNNWSAVCIDDQILYPSGTVNTPVGYACCYGAGTLGVYDRGTITWTYKTITSRNYTGITSIGDYLYLSVDGGYVYKVNKTTLATTTLCYDSREWTGLTNDGTYLYASVNNGNIYRINISTGVSEIILGDTSGDTTTRNWKGVVYSRRYNCLYAVVNGGALWEIDLYGAKAPYATSSMDATERKYNIQIFSETSSVSIKYTIDGSVPSATNGITYTGVFSVVSNCTVKYCAIKDGQVVYGSDVVISFNTLYVYDESNASWKLVTIPYVSNAGAWKQTNAIYEMVSGVWTRIY